jgi:hypothetical protein
MLSVVNAVLLKPFRRQCLPATCRPGGGLPSRCLADGTKVRLTRALKQRMQQAAYAKWVAEALKDEAEETAAADCAFNC